MASEDGIRLSAFGRSGEGPGEFRAYTELIRFLAGTACVTTFPGGSFFLWNCETIGEAKEAVMFRVLMGLGLGFALLLGFGCADIVAPVDDFELPQPDMSFDPDRLAIGEYIATPCAFGKFGDGLEHLRENDEWALVDIFFGRDSPDGPWTGPTVGDVEFVRSHGGRVLHRFNVPAVRARIVVSRIPDLVKEGLWITVREVPDASRYDLELHVGFNRPLTDSDSVLIAGLGGRITHRWDFINALAVLLPDPSVPDLRERSDVEYVEVNGVACLQ